MMTILYYDTELTDSQTFKVLISVPLNYVDSVFIMPSKITEDFNILFLN